MIKERMRRIFDRMTRKHPVIVRRYKMFKARHAGLHRMLRPLSWGYLACLILKYSFFGRDPKKELVYPQSAFAAFGKEEKLLRAAAGADVVLFDVFGGLLLTAVQEEADLFEIVGRRLGVNDYKTVRAAAERELREGGNVPALAEICALLARHGIDPSAAYAEELRALRALCGANGYYSRLCEKLRGKRVAAVDGGCYPRAFIENLLRESGFCVERAFVACEEEVRAAGGPGGAVRAAYADKKAVYFGCGCLQGVERVFVPTLSEACGEYHGYGFRSLVSSAYCALADERLHTGAPVPPFYEYGFAYGGMLAFGFCRYLEELAAKEGYDQFLFLARDSQLFFEIYQKYCGNVPAFYLHTSRFAAMKLAFPQYSDLFMRAMVFAKARKNEKIPLGKALAQAELSSLQNKLEEYGLAPAMPLNEESAPRLIRMLYDCRDGVAACYREEKEAFGRYIAPVIGGKKRVCLVDLGWQGTIFTMLDGYFSERFPEVRLSCALVGAGDTELSDPLIDGGRMHAFLFSHTHGAECRVKNEEVMLLETLFSSTEPMTVGYRMAEGGAEPVFGEAEKGNKEAYMAMHRGVLDFCEAFSERLSRLPGGLRISAAEAFAPLREVIADRKYNLALFGGLRAAAEPNAEFVTMRQLLHEMGYKS